MEPIWIGCPATNFRHGRPAGFRPEAIVVHIMDGSFADGDAVFSNPSTQKSAHYGISKTGVIHQYVDDKDTAYHAGVVVSPSWDLLKPGVNPNFYTIGIEHEGRPDDVWTSELLLTSATLIGQMASRWNIPLDTEHVIRHHQIRASKTCPGNWLLDVQTLLDLVPKATPSPLPAIQTVRVLRDLCLRSGQPSTHSPIVRILSPSTRVAVAGFTLGERVAANSYWYLDAEGNYFWAGATDVPVPAQAKARP